jgi:hypothetical protein
MFKQYRDLTHGEHILVGVDTSMGGNDYVAAQFVSRKHLDVPLVYHSKETATVLTNKLPEVLEKIHTITGVKPLVAYERNNGGSFEMDRIAAMNRNGKYEIFKMPGHGRIDIPDAVKLGWDTNSASRPKMLTELKEAIDKHVIHIYDKPTINEMFAFIVVQTTSSWKAQAEQGAHDDLIMSLAIAWQLYAMAPQPIQEQYIQPNDFKKWEI